MTSIHVRHRPGRVHDQVQFFAGPDEDHRASLGWLNARRDEAKALWHLLGGRVNVAGAFEDIYVDVVP